MNRQCQNKINGIQCTNKAEHGHHPLSNTKHYRKVYGKKRLDKYKICYCSTCHLNKSIFKLTEKEFCKLEGIEIQSKSGQEVRQIK